MHRHHMMMMTHLLASTAPVQSLLLLQGCLEGARYEVRLLADLRNGQKLLVCNQAERQVLTSQLEHQSLPIHSRHLHDAQ